MATKRPSKPEDDNTLLPFLKKKKKSDGEAFLVLRTRRPNKQPNALSIMTLAEPLTCTDYPARNECQLCEWCAQKATEQGVTGSLELDATDLAEYQMISMCIGLKRAQYHHPVQSYHLLPEEPLLSGIRGKQTTVCSVTSYLTSAQRARVLEWITEHSELGYAMPQRMVCIQDKYCQAIQNGRKVVETRSIRLV